MRMTAIGFAFLLLCHPAEAAASHQDSAQATKPPLVLREGTAVHLNFAQQVTSQRARDGEPVEFVLADDLKVGDRVAVAAGARAIGVVVRKKEFHVRPTWLEAGHIKVPLRGLVSIPEMGAEVINQGQAVIRQEVQGAVFVDADTELPWPGEQSPSASNEEKSASGESEVPANKIRLPNAVLVRLMLMQSISSKTVKAGDSVKFQVLDPVRVDKQVVIANKAPAGATITAAHSAGMAWRGGGLEMWMDFVTLVDLQKQPLQARSTAKGTPTNAAYNWGQAINESQGWAILFLPFAPLQHGREAIVSKGTVFTAMTSGDALLDRSVVESSQPPAVEKKHGNASVTVYYPNLGSTSSFPVWCGLARVGRAKKGRRFTLTLPPGKYVFRLGPKGLPFTLEAEDGGEHFLEVMAMPSEGSRGAEIGFLQVDHDVGEVESADTIPAEAKDAPDMTKLDLAQLQAEPPAKKHR
jgi:hypothetical protein